MNIVSAGSESNVERLKLKLKRNVTDNLVQEALYPSSPRHHSPKTPKKSTSEKDTTLSDETRYNTRYVT